MHLREAAVPIQGPMEKEHSCMTGPRAPGIQDSPQDPLGLQAGNQELKNPGPTPGIYSPNQCVQSTN